VEHLPGEKLPKYETIAHTLATILSLYEGRRDSRWRRSAAKPTNSYEAGRIAATQRLAWISAFHQPAGQK
jgi:hypothetical protein